MRFVTSMSEFKFHSPKCLNPGDMHHLIFQRMIRHETPVAVEGKSWKEEGWGGERRGEKVDHAAVGRSWMNEGT